MTQVLKVPDSALHPMNVMAEHPCHLSRAGLLSTVEFTLHSSVRVVLCDIGCNGWSPCCCPPHLLFLSLSSLILHFLLPSSFFCKSSRNLALFVKMQNVQATPSFLVDRGQKWTPLLRHICHQVLGPSWCLGARAVTEIGSTSCLI